MNFIYHLLLVLALLALELERLLFAVPLVFLFCGLSNAKEGDILTSWWLHFDEIGVFRFVSSVCIIEMFTKPNVNKREECYYINERNWKVKKVYFNFDKREEVASQMREVSLKVENVAHIRSRIGMCIYYVFY